MAVQGSPFTEVLTPIPCQQAVSFLLNSHFYNNFYDIKKGLFTLETGCELC